MLTRMRIRMFTQVLRAFAVVLAFLLVCSFAGAVSAAASDPGAAHAARFELSDATLWDSSMNLIWPRTLAPAAGPVVWTAAAGFMAQLNKDKYLGHDDWRLPSREELSALVEYVKGAGFDGSAAGVSLSDGFHAIGLQGITGDCYWTSSESWYNQGRAWAVDLSTGNAGIKDKVLTCRVIAVRSMQ